MAHLTDTTIFRLVNSETDMYDASNVDTLINGLSATCLTSAQAYTKDQTYSKGEVDGMVAGAYKVKGSVETYANLPSTGNNIGDVWNVKDTGMNYVWVSANEGGATVYEWDDLGGMANMSNYYTISAVDALLSAKVDKVAGMGLSHNDFTDTLTAKLAGIEDGADVNQNAFSYVHVPNYQNIVAGSETATLNIVGGLATTVSANPSTSTILISTDISGKVDKVAGMGLSEANFTSAEKEKLQSIQANAEQNQDAFASVVTNSGTATADDESAALTLTGAGIISTKAVGKTVTISANMSGYVPTSYTINGETLTGTSAEIDAGSIPMRGGEDTTIFEVLNPINNNYITVDADGELVYGKTGAGISGPVYLDGARIATIPDVESAVSAKADTSALNGYVLKTHTINGRPLSGTGTTISAEDIPVGFMNGTVEQALADFHERYLWISTEESPLPGSDIRDSGGLLTELSLSGKLVATENYVDAQTSGKVDKVDGMGLSHNDYTTAEKNKLAGIASGAEVNQNAFSYVAVGSSQISAAGKTSTLTVSGGAGAHVNINNNVLTISTDAGETYVSKTAVTTALTDLALSALPTTNYTLDSVVAQYNRLVGALANLKTALS